MSESRCPVKLDGPHFIDWMIVPESIHDGDFGLSVTPEYKRGICLDCGEQFTN